MNHRHCTAAYVCVSNGIGRCWPQDLRSATVGKSSRLEATKEGSRTEPPIEGGPTPSWSVVGASVTTLTSSSPPPLPHTQLLPHNAVPATAPPVPATTATYHRLRCPAQLPLLRPVRLFAS